MAPKVVKLQTDTSLLFFGLGIGFSIAIIGGLVDYLLSRRENNLQKTNYLPGCMLYIAGVLGLLGIISIITSLILSGGIGPAIMLGAGVLGGFYSGFALLIVLYLAINRLWPHLWD